MHRRLRFEISTRDGKNGIWANRDITLAVERGEILGILGPNGAGKTTLIRQITTELLPTSGDVQVMGHSAVSEPTRVKSLMGTIPQWPHSILVSRRGIILERLADFMVCPSGILVLARTNWSKHSGLATTGTKSPTSWSGGAGESSSASP